MARFAEQPVMSFLADGRRLSLRHGPIDLVIEADGKPTEVKNAYDAAQAAFPYILGNLVEELSFLRTSLTEITPPPDGQVARIMYQAALPFVSNHLLTPMIAVAGSVADFVLQQMTKNAILDRAYVNNGGDIALHLAPGNHFDIGICTNLETRAILDKACIQAEDGMRGIATSGWRGRSHSLGMADAVTVLAKTAAKADVAATLIANAVNCDAPYAVKRMPACDLSPDSDLGDQPVTVNVGRLKDHDISEALSNGHRKASEFFSEHMIEAAFISLQGNSVSLSREDCETSLPMKSAIRVQSHYPEYAHA